MNTTSDQTVFANNTGIIEAEIAEVRAMIGQPLRIKQWNVEAAIDNIRHYSWGIGDDNPLFTDEAYAAASPHGGLVAPPTFFYAIWPAGIGPGFPGLQAYHAGGRWEINRYARQGERIVAEAKLTDLKDVQGKRAGRMLIQIGEVIYKNQDGEILARHESRAFRIARKGADENSGLKYEARNVTWTEAELDAMEAEILAQTRRGAEPLYFEDVQIGDIVPSRLKGPLNMSTMITYYAGNLGGNSSTDMAVRHRHMCLTKPELVSNNRPAAIQAERASYGQGHHDAKVAAAVGMPGVYDNGWMRIGWAQQMVTDWIGDHGVVSVLDVGIHLPNILGDIVRFKGSVTGKRQENGKNLIEIELRGERQDGELSCKGTAVVALPARG